LLQCPACSNLLHCPAKSKAAAVPCVIKPATVPCNIKAAAVPCNIKAAAAPRVNKAAAGPYVIQLLQCPLSITAAVCEHTCRCCCALQHQSCAGSSPWGWPLAQMEGPQGWGTRSWCRWGCRGRGTPSCWAQGSAAAEQTITGRQVWVVTG
jgi:hypothetical protein